MNKTRLTIFGVLCIFLFLAASLGTEMFIGIFDGDTDGLFQDNISIDGADFSVFFNFFIILFFGFLLAASGTVLCLFSLVAVLLLRLIAIRKNSIILKTEYDMSRKILLYTAVGSVIFQFIIFHFQFWFFTVLYNAAVAGVIYLVYILALSNHMAEMQEVHYESEIKEYHEDKQNYENLYGRKE